MSTTPSAPPRLGPAQGPGNAEAPDGTSEASKARGTGARGPAATAQAVAGAAVGSTSLCFIL